MDNAQLAARIRRACENAGVAISTVLAKCEIRQSLLYDMEKRGKKPSIEIIEKIASYLGVSVDYLLGRAETPEIKNSPPETDGEYGQIVASGGHGVIVLKRASDAPKEGVVRVSLTYSSGVTESHDVDEEATHTILSLIRLVEIK